MSYADKWTDAELVKLEKKIARVYANAQKDLNAQAKSYFKQFEKRDKEMLKKVESGAVTEDYYKQWRLAQMGRGKRFDKMASDMAERATKANEVAVAYVNDATPGIYSLNRNHEAYIIEGIGHEMVGADFSLYNEQAVRRLIVEEPELMPYYPKEKAVNRGIDLAYGKQQIQKNVTSGILRGASVYKIADDLQRDITNMNRASAIRTARTAITAAQNGGRQATMDSAKAMGIKLRKRWVAAKDGRTRDVHGVADGQTVPTDEPFIVGGEKMMFPGDRTSASGWNIYNCRCGMRTVEKEGIEAEPRQVRVRNPKTGRNELVNDMTYTEWAKMRGFSSENELTSSNSGGKLYRGLERKNKNSGGFSELTVPIKKKEVFKICKKYGVDTSNLTIKIQHDKDYLGVPYYGSTDYERIGRIDLFPMAFESEEQLVRTVLHEKCHVMQLRKYGKSYTQDNLEHMESQAYYYEEKLYNYLKKKVK